MRQCLLRLASVLVHEAWHSENGRDERGAYEEQIAFLLRNGAATEHVAAVRLAQKRACAAAPPDGRRERDGASAVAR